MSNENNINETSTNDQNESLKAEATQNLKNWKESTSKWLNELLDIRSNTDKPNTIKHIKEDIPFKGHTAWILMCAVFIASIGLNANSTAVVIGAMLISPLMGPILGMGMAIAINDINTLKRAAINFMVMVVISVLTAFLFFFIFPIKAESSELLARTAPDFRDVMIAFFGGLALIIARTKEGTIASVIFGVAIATALMPPLCTAGYGLAVGNLNYFSGAMYLFTINTIFIALATYLILKLLRFPMVKYANQKTRARTTRIVSVIAILVMVPAIITFIRVFQKQMFMSQAQTFVNKEIKTTVFDKKTNFLDKLTAYDYAQGEFSLFDLKSYIGRNTNGKENKISLVFLGEKVPQVVVDNWNQKLLTYNNLNNTKIEITDPNSTEQLNDNTYITELYEKVKEESQNKNTIIANLKDELERTKKQVGNQVAYRDVINKAHTIYPELASISYYQKFESVSLNRVDSSLVFELDWDKKLKAKNREALESKFKEWLKLEVPKHKISVE